MTAGDDAPEKRVSFSPMGRLQDKVCLVTGGASGIGLATTKAFAREGGIVVLADLDAAAGREVVGGLGEPASFLALDVTDEAAWETGIAQVVARYGRLDVLVNNAGILSGTDVVNTTMEEWRRVMAVNADGPFLGCKHAVAAMAEVGGGSIVNVASMASYSGAPPLVAYAASKAVVRSLTQTTAVYCMDQRNGVRCNSVHPGPIATPMTGLQSGQELPGLGAAGAPEDVANGILYLASDEARHVNGTALVIDNAITAR